MKFWMIINCVCFSFFKESEGTYHDSITSYDKLYDLGMDAYKNGRWDACISFFNDALKDYNFYKNTVTGCRIQCRQSEKSEGNGKSFEEMLFVTLKESRCLRKCKKQKFGKRPEEEISSPYEKKFQDRQPYNYLQFCYFKNDDIHNAASTAYTYYLTHQDDDRILETLNYYKDLPDIEEEDFVDLERKPHQKAYIDALMYYNNGDWQDAAENFELSLTEYFKEEEKCRAYCEKGFVHSKYPDFINAVADHYVMVVVCQQKCLQTLSTFGMEEIENYVSEHYNYLQYSYYQVKNLEKASEAIASSLLFRPTNQEMLNNKDYYIKTHKYTEDDFVPSKASMEYVNLWKELDASISFIRDHYLLPNDLVAVNEEEEEEKSDLDQSDLEDEGNMVDSIKKEEHYMAKFERLGVRLFAESEALGGEGRFAADNFIRKDQCHCLADPAMDQVPDDFGVKSIGLLELTDLLKEDSEYEITLRLLMRAVNVMSIYTQSYFNQSGLTLKEVKVVCLPKGDNKLPEDCVLQEDGTCIHSLAKGVYRSVAYLSDVSDGTGQMYFMDNNENSKTHISPKCGRLVGFRGDDKHGVNLSWKKERCAVIVDISDDKEDYNLVTDVLRIKQLLKDFQDERELTKNDIDNSDILNQFYSQGITISKTGKDLYGEERFVADGLSTQSECEELVDIAKKQAVSGDGYRGNVSPHSNREIFSGLDIHLAEQKGVIRGDGYEEDQSDNTAGSRFVSPYTKNEHFEGLNVSRSLEMVDSKVLAPRSLQLLLDISDHGRLLTEKYFNLTRPLFFDFTHLVCRTAIDDLDDKDGGEEGADELSHPIHADNCVIYPNGSCIADSQSFKQRHYSAVLYLNEDFKGGQFFFAHKNQTEHIYVQPKCGRLVAFNAGEFHGVRAVRQGKRCAIAMWYTHDPNFYEVSRLNARRRLDKTLPKTDEVTEYNKELQDGIDKTDQPIEVFNSEFEKGRDEL